MSRTSQPSDGSDDDGEADPELNPQFKELKKVAIPDGGDSIYDPDQPSERWIATDTIVYLCTEL